MGATRTCCSVLLAILLPPIGVFLQFGCGLELCINILLTCLGYIPGIIHALCIIGFASDDHKGLPVTHPPHAQPAVPQQGYVPPPYPPGAYAPAMGHPVAPPPPQHAYPQHAYPQQPPQAGAGYPAVPPAGYPPKT